ncbi:MAG: FAD-binding oxidoreductase [Chloroflexota bacterium]|nr:FAD-binding oxidoreductase [Chloroflexota bacterium]
MAVEIEDRSAYGDLERSFRGKLIDPDHPAYEAQRRVWNGSIDRRPALIARCSDRADVAGALAFARRAGLTVAVRGGGHSFPGFSVVDGGIVIDLGPMKRIDVDPERRVARAEGGVLLGELDRATQAYGLAVPLGSVTHTGIAGLTLGGGFGWLMRKHGLTVDTLLAAEVVTAAGEVVQASAADNADLFWGLRGGGGNFGIVISFTYRLNPVGPMVVSGLVLWALEDGAKVGRFYREWALAAPDELTTALIVRRAPAVDLIPAELHGRPVIGVACCWVGEHDRGEAMLAPMRRFGTPIVDLVGRRPFIEHQGLLDPSFPHGIWIYSKASDVAALSDGVLEVMLDHGARIRSLRSGMIAWQLGGAVARVDAFDTAFSSTRSGYLVDVLGATDSADGFAIERQWARDCWDALAPHRTGAYVNWLMEEGAARVREVYGEERYRRLQAVKRRYDPENVFHLNQNIVPG